MAFGALEKGVDSDHGAPGMQPQNAGHGVAKGINQGESKLHRIGIEQ